MAGRRGRQALPVHPGHQPAPLLRGQGKEGLAGLGPGETAPMQAALAQPGAVAVPHQQLEAVAAVGKGCTWTGISSGEWESPSDL